MTQKAIAELYQTTPQNITLHIKNIYEENELVENSTCKNYLQVQTEGNRSVQRNSRHYNLEMIIAIGYRVRSSRGTQFRRWATERLNEYLVKGFTMDDERLKGISMHCLWIMMENQMKLKSSLRLEVPGTEPLRRYLRQLFEMFSVLNGFRL